MQSHIGISSAPIVTAEPGNGMLTLTLLSEHPGVLNSEDAFKFIITVIDINGELSLHETVDFPDYVSNMHKIVSFALPAGEYYITVIASNRYGNSDESQQLKVTVHPQIPASTISTQSTQPSESSIPSDKTSKC